MKAISAMCLLFMMLLFFGLGMEESRFNNSNSFVALFLIILELIPLMYILYGG